MPKKPKQTVAQRNAEILETLKSGVSVRRVANDYNLSTSRVRKIHTTDRQDKEQANIRKLRLVMVRSSGVNHKWDVAGLLDCLNLPQRITNALKRFYRNKGIQEISLMEFMDLVICDNPDPEESFGRNPVYKVRGIFKYGVRDILKAMTVTDFGVEANKEWARRFKEYAVERM